MSPVPPKRSPSVPPVADPGTPSGLAPTPASTQPGVIVDMHTQIWESLDQLGSDAADAVRRSLGDPWDRPDMSVSAYDQAMETVHYAVILGFESRHLGASIPAGQVARYVVRNPEKYLGFAGVDPNADGFLAAVNEAMQLGLVGVTISPAAAAFHPSDSRAMRLYERCEELGLPVMVHPGTHFGGSAILEFSQPYLFDEVARTFPGLRLILAGVGFPWADQAMVLIGKHQHCYADISDLTRRPWQLYNALLLAHQQGVVNRLLFGSDYPFTTPGQAILNMYSVNTLIQGTHLPTVPREQLRGIVERDALTCLGIKVPGRGDTAGQAQTPEAANVAD